MRRIVPNQRPKMKRLLSPVAVALGFAGVASAQQHFNIGTADVIAPAVWTEVSRAQGRLTLHSADRVVSNIASGVG